MTCLFAVTGLSLAQLAPVERPVASVEFVGIHRIAVDVERGRQHAVALHLAQVRLGRAEPLHVEALDLFEEAVSLGLKVSDYVEKGIVVDDPETVTDAATSSETATSGESSPNADGAAASGSPAPNESATE